MTGLGLALVAPVVVVAAATPTPGRYAIDTDQVTIRKEVWSVYCDMKADETKPTVGTSLDVELKDGGEWIARGGGRLFGTGQCEGQNKGLAPESRAKKDGKIVMKCRSARVTLGTEATEQKVWSTTDAIWFQVSARRTFRHHGDDCISVLDRRTKAHLVEAAGGAKPPPPEEKEPEEAAAPAAPVDPCEKPGALATLVLSPRVAVAKVGDKPACFEVTAQDGNGCPVDAGKASFAVEPTSAGDVDAKGCFKPSALKEEQLIAIVAKAGGLEASASARVIPKGEEKSEKSLETLAKASSSKRVKEVIGEVTRGAFTIRPLETEPELPPLEAPPFPWGVVGGVAAFALLATGGGVTLALRRRRREEEPTELQAKPVVTPKKGGGLVCPQCSFEFAVGEASHCPFDNTELKPLERDARQTMFVPAAGGMVCPKCHTKYPTKARFCGHDRSPLLPDFGQFDKPGGP